jgi:F0F1-type ATP synthase assembly protein I
MTKLSRWVLLGGGVILVVSLLVAAGLSASSKKDNPSVSSKPTQPSQTEIDNQIAQKKSEIAKKVKELNGATTPTPITKSSKSSTPTNKITLDSLSTVLIGFDITRSNDRYIGYSQDGRSNMTLIGSKNDIKAVMLSLNDIKRDEVLSDTDLMESTLNAALPEWKSRTWLGNALTKFSTSTDPDGDSDETDVGNKHVLLGYSTLNDSLSLTITVK